MTRAMRTNHRIGARIKRKWGKVGAPHSAKRKCWLKRIHKRKKRKKRRKVTNGRARAEYEKWVKREFAPKSSSVIKRVMRKGGIKNGKSGAVRDYGKYSEIPLCCRRKRGLPFDEMADELRMSDEKLWESLVYRR